MLDLSPTNGLTSIQNTRIFIPSLIYTPLSPTKMSSTSTSGLVNGLSNMSISTGYGSAQALQFLRFNGKTSFTTFSIRFKALFNTVQQGLGKVIDDTEEAPSAGDDSKAYDILVNALDDQMITTIVADSPSCRAAWKTLQESIIGNKLDRQM